MTIIMLVIISSPIGELYFYRKYIGEKKRFPRSVRVEQPTHPDTSGRSNAKLCKLALNELSSELLLVKTSQAYRRR